MAFLIEPHQIGELLISRALSALASVKALDRVFAFRRPSPVGRVEEIALDKLFPASEFCVRCGLDALTDAAGTTIIFDGEHEIDVVAVRRAGGSVSGFPLEVKLGRKALTAKTFEKRYLIRPTADKQSPPRVSGTIPGLLDQYSAARSPDLIRDVDRKITVPHQAIKVSLTEDDDAERATLLPEWGIVVRGDVSEKWKKECPAFHPPGPWVITVNDLVAALGSDSFNRLVAGCLLDIPDYATAWGFVK